MEIIEQIFTNIIAILESIFEFTSGLISGVPKKKEGYNADFAWESSLLSSWNKGFNLTGKKSLSVKNSYQNALIVGGTGAGKSSVVLIPSLFTMQGSFVIHDPSGELYSKTSGYLSKKGYEIKVLNFTKPHLSSGYNPIQKAFNSSEVQKVASMLIENSMGGKSKDPFWNTQATSLLTMLITILKKQGKEEYQNLYNVRQLLNRMGGNPGSVDALFSKYADEILFAEYKSFLSFDEKVVSGVIATCKATLNLFTDESVAKVTSYDNIDFQDFRRKPTALFIQNSVADQKYYSVLTSLFFEQFFAFIFLRFPGEHQYDISFLIDEASSLKLPTLPLAVANVRKHRAKIMLLVQDFNQLVHQYGKQEADGIKSNTFAKLFFTGQSLETCKELEQTLGKYEYKDKDEKKNVRSLMTSDEIRTMKSNRGLLICGHYPPILARLKPYYKRIKFRNYSLIPPPEINSLAPIDSIPVLPINPTADEQEG